MSGQNSENLASDKMAGSYVLALKHNNNTYKDNAEPDGEIFNVKPVFILELDIFGSSKPDKNNYLTHTELFKCIDLTIPANHLNGLQRVIGGVWRIYPDSEEDRESLVVNSITGKSALRTSQKLNVPNACKKVIKKQDCNNDWKCKTCGANGHISKDCTAEFNENSQADSEVSSEESDETSEDESEKGEEIVLSQSTENLLDTPHTKETSKKKLNFPKIQTTYMYRNKTHLN
ncbi:CNBP [Mytilus coruscus]|uniref:CNBP n=1 Tax=Mytilus coruscus TaxID=42192 RepID=A0A6J8DAQ9_MYTCO|nr:CNBP [Mytilus coruscus]